MAESTYLSKEPEGLEGPEAREGVEEEGVGVRGVVASEEAHFIDRLRVEINY